MGKRATKTKNIDNEIAGSIEQLLKSRPDLALRSYRDFAQLRSAAHGRSSLSHCLAHLSMLDMAVHAVIEAVSPVSAVDVDRLLNNPGIDHIDGALTRLSDRWLIKKVDDGKWVIDAELQRSGPGMAGLGHSFKDLAIPASHSEINKVAEKLGLAPGKKKVVVDEIARWMSEPHNVDSLVSTAPPGAKRLLGDLASSGNPTHFSAHAYGQRRSNTDDSWLIARGLLMPVHWGTFELPSEVAISLRGGVVMSGIPTQPPALEIKARPAASSLHSCLTAVTFVDDLCRTVDALHPQGLKNGGVGVKEVRRLASALTSDERTLAFWLDLAYAAGLITMRNLPAEPAPRRGAPPQPRREVQTTGLFASWRSESLGDRWLHLARTWLSAPMRFDTDDESRKRPPLDAKNRDVMLVCARSVFISAIASHGDVEISATDEELTVHVMWHAAGVFTHIDRPVVPSMTRECELLGLWQKGPTSIASLLASDNFEDAIKAVNAAAPAEVDDITVQADGTIVIGGTPSTKLLRSLEPFADVTARDAAHVMSISEPSIRRALDAGHEATAILEVLEANANKGVPQAVKYLVEDVNRRYGHLLVGSAKSFVVATDAAVAADAVRHKAVSKLKARLVAPTVIVADVEQSLLIETLRTAGFLPVTESGSEGDRVAKSLTPPKAPLAVYERPVFVHSTDVDMVTMAEQIASGVAPIPQKQNDYMEERVIDALSEIVDDLSGGAVSEIGISGIVESPADIAAMVEVAASSNNALLAIEPLNSSDGDPNGLHIISVRGVYSDNIFGVDLTSDEHFFSSVQNIHRAVLITPGEGWDWEDILYG